MLIMQLYPWLSVREVSYNVIADGSIDNMAKAASNSTQPIAGEKEPPKKEKKGFISKIFKK